MKTPSKNLWQRFRNLNDLVQFVLVLGSSGVIGGIAFLVSSIRHLLLKILTTPVIQWHTETWATALVLSAIVFSFLFLLGHALGSRRNAQQEPVGKPLSIIPEHYGFWGPYKGPIEAMVHFQILIWVTNVSAKPVNIVKCELSKFNLPGGMEILNRQKPGGFGQEFHYLPDDPGICVKVLFFSPSRIKQLRQDIETDIVFTDNLGNKYIAPSCKMIYVPLGKNNDIAKIKKAKAIKARRVAQALSDFNEATR